MKPFILFLFGFCVPLSLLAQDDMYFVPSSKKAEPVVEQVVYNPHYEDAPRDVDEYNRRGVYNMPADSVQEQAETETDDAGMSCTERIIMFHSPSVGIYVSSPYYWDFCYDPWWYSPWYGSYWGWRSWWWYDPWYPHWGWGPPYWGPARPPHHIVHVGDKVGQWRPGPTGGYVRYGNNYRTSSAQRYSATGRNFSTGGRSQNAVNRRFTTGRRNFNAGSQNGLNTGLNRNNNTNRRMSTPDNAGRSFTPNRSFGTPSRSMGAPARSMGAPRGGGRSFGGRR